MNLDQSINYQVCFSFACQVLEYQPQPWNQWVQVGDLVQARVWHTTLSIGPEQLPCLSGESFNMEMINKGVESRRMIDEQRYLGNDNWQWHHHMDSKLIGISEISDILKP